jgi:hypothetical protein
MSLAREKIKIAEALTPALPTPMGKTIARMTYSAMLETMYSHEPTGDSGAGIN